MLHRHVTHKKKQHCAYLYHAIAVSIWNVGFKTTEKSLIVMFEVKIFQAQLGIFYRDLNKTSQKTFWCDNHTNPQGQCMYGNLANQHTKSEAFHTTISLSYKLP